MNNTLLYLLLAFISFTLTSCHDIIIEGIHLISAIKSVLIFIPEFYYLLNGNLNKHIVNNFVKINAKDVKIFLRQTVSSRKSYPCVEKSHQYEDEIDKANSWLAAFNYNLCQYILTDCYFSLDTIDQNADIDAFEALYKKVKNGHFQSITSKFYALTANKNVNHDLILVSYQAFKDNQERTSKLLEFGQEVLNQRQEISGFIEKYKYMKNMVLAPNSCLEDLSLFDHFYSDLMCRFSWISYPQIDIEGLDQIVYEYNCSLYLQMSRMKLDFIHSCEQL